MVDSFVSVYNCISMCNTACDLMDVWTWKNYIAHKFIKALLQYCENWVWEEKKITNCDCIRTKEKCISIRGMVFWSSWMKMKIKYVWSTWGGRHEQKKTVERVKKKLNLVFSRGHNL